LKKLFKTKGIFLNNSSYSEQRAYISGITVFQNGSSLKTTGTGYACEQNKEEIH
jgi:hypothetical protein